MELPKITSVMLNVTHACNLRCRYCFVHQQPQTMTYQVALDTVKFLLDNCEDGVVPGINYFGGEPMICWDSIIVPLTKYIRNELQRPFLLSMTSNGTLLNTERIQFLKDNDIGLLLSIDGAKETQDYNRPCADGRSSFEALRENLPIIAREFNTTFRMTVIPDTVQHLFTNIQFAIDSGFTSFFVMPNVFEDWSDTAWEALEEEVKKYGDYYISCYQCQENPIRFSEFETMFRRIKQINSAVKRDVFRENSTARYKCGLGMSRFASIHPNGDIYGCQELTSNEGKESIFWIGNLATGVDDNRRVSLAHYFDDSEIIGSHCDRCRLRRICDGGCVANNYLATGSLNHVPEVFCRWQRLLLTEAIRVTWALGDNEAFIRRWEHVLG